MEGKQVTVYGDGSNIRDWIHVNDHNRGVEAIIERGEIGETYCLGGGNELSNLEITKEILAIMGVGEEMIQYVPDRLGHDWRYAIDYSKAERELGWKPEKNFSQGIRETAEWYRNNRAWWEGIKYKKQEKQ
jgi:dTDP-glucose 4,6-dehydratase